jgi:AcrR family transcriptional regulator
MVDARVIHTHVALSAAILELAAQRSVSQISVAEVARQAGINRATFYNHYLSPGALLADVITHELDKVRAAAQESRLSSSESGEDTTRNAVAAVVTLVQAHHRVFELALLDPEDASLHHALSAHFEVSCRQHLEHYAEGSGEAIEIDIVAHFVAEGMVGAIESWLLDPAISAERLTTAIVSAMPRWWN